MAHPGGRPTTYTEEMVERAREYLANCGEDEVTEFHKTRGEKSDSFERILKVNLPTVEGLALYLGIHRNTLYEWTQAYKEFGDVVDDIKQEQAKRLISKGLSGEYSPKIAALMLAKHGYHEKQELEINDKRLVSDDYTDTPTQ